MVSAQILKLPRDPGHFRSLPQNGETREQQPEPRPRAGPVGGPAPPLPSLTIQEVSPAGLRARAHHPPPRPRGPWEEGLSPALPSRPCTSPCTSPCPPVLSLVCGLTQLHRPHTQSGWKIPGLPWSQRDAGRRLLAAQHPSSRAQASCSRPLPRVGKEPPGRWPAWVLGVTACRLPLQDSGPEPSNGRV